MSFKESLDAMRAAAETRRYEDAALSALELADFCTGDGVREYIAQAQVYATLYQAQTAVWIAESRQPMMFDPS